jgi:hypothetical protein
VKAAGLVCDKTIYVLSQFFGLITGDEAHVSEDLANAEATALVRNLVVRCGSESASLSRAFGEAKYNDLWPGAAPRKRISCDSPITLGAL